MESFDNLTDFSIDPNEIEDAINRRIMAKVQACPYLQSGEDCGKHGINECCYGCPRAAPDGPMGTPQDDVPPAFRDLLDTL